MGEMQYYNYSSHVKSRLKLVSKIFNIIGVIAILISAVSLIMLSTKEFTKNKSYKYSNTILGIPFEISITLKDDSVAFVSTTVFGKSESGESKYYVEDGILYMESDDEENPGFKKVGKITTTKIVLEGYEDTMGMDLVCKSAKIQQKISIAVVISGAVILAIGIIINIIDKRRNKYSI